MTNIPNFYNKQEFSTILAESRFVCYNENSFGFIYDIEFALLEIKRNANGCNDIIAMQHTKNDVDFDVPVMPWHIEMINEKLNEQARECIPSETRYTDWLESIGLSYNTAL